MMERWLGGKLKRRWMVIVPLTRSAGTDDYLSIKFIKLISSGVGAWWIAILGIWRLFYRSATS